MTFLFSTARVRKGALLDIESHHRELTFGCDTSNAAQKSDEKSVPANCHKDPRHCFDYGLECPQSWERLMDWCYLFVRTPELSWLEAQPHCRKYFADLLSIESPEEHELLVAWFRLNDPTLSTWYTSGFDAASSGDWLWTASAAPDRRISNSDAAWAFHGVPVTDYHRVTDPAVGIAPPLMGRALAYNFSSLTKAWTWLPVTPDRNRPFVCEIPIQLAAHVPDLERNLDYGSNQENPDEIDAAPVIVQEPVDTVFDTTSRSSRNSSTIRCVASGYPPPEYTWYRVRHQNGEQVSHVIDKFLEDPRLSMTDGALTIYNPESSKDRGEYYCSATNKLGTVISRRVTINFGYVGDFALRREPMRLVTFSGAVVPCDPPSHFPAVSFAWARDAFPNFVEENKRVFVSKDGNLYFSHVELADEGTYQCVVKSVIADVGKTGPFFKILVRRDQSVGQLKIWSSFPKVFPFSPVIGDNVTVECFASGYPTPHYEWKRSGGVAMPVGYSIIKSGRVLRIPSAQIGDSGDYECRASNMQGAVSAVLTLDVKARPHFLVRLRPQIADAGTDVTWTCAAFARPPPLYRWYKDGVQLESKFLQMVLEDRKRYQIDSNRLTIREVQDTRDTGVYQCEAENVLGTALSAAELRVVSFRPNFRRRPLEPVVHAAGGGNVTMICEPDGAPQPSVRWTHNGVPVEPSPRVSVLGNGKLMISPVLPQDQGSYACEATNQLGNDRSEGFLKVLHGPRMLEVPMAIQVAFNQSAIMRCTAEADPSLDVSYEWRLNGLPVDMSQNARFFTGWKQQRGYLFIRYLTFSEAGEYTCIVKTPVAEIAHSARLEVIGPPGPPSGLRAVKNLRFTPNSVTLQWTDGARNGFDDPGFYRVEAITNHTTTYFVLADGVSARNRFNSPHGKECDLVSILQPWNAYRFRIRAGNFFGFGEPSTPSSVYDVPPAPPQRPPLFISGGAGREDALSVVWQPLPPQEQNGPGIGYKVLYRKINSSDEVGKARLEDYGSHIMEGSKGRAVIRIRGSEVFQPYEVRIRAFNMVGDGPFSDNIIVNSGENTPLVAPTNVHASPFNATAIIVKWDPVPDIREVLRGRILGHRVKYWRRDWDQEDAWIVLFPGPDNSALIKGLEPLTEYFVSVMAVTSAGNGPESEPFVARTFRSEPREFPMGVRVRVRDWASVTVDWRGIMTGPQEEPIEGYKIRYWRQGEDINAASDLVLPLMSLFGKLEAVLGGLTPGQSYNLRVLGYSDGGDGRMSSPVWQFRMVVPKSSSAAEAHQTPEAFWLCLLLLFFRAFLSLPSAFPGAL